MTKTVLLDELHLTVLAPRGLPEPEYSAIRRTLTRARFHAALDRAIREVFSRYPALRRARLDISR